MMKEGQTVYRVVWDRSKGYPGRPSIQHGKITITGTKRPLYHATFPKPNDGVCEEKPQWQHESINAAISHAIIEFARENDGGAWPERKETNVTALVKGICRLNRLYWTMYDHGLIK